MGSFEARVLHAEALIDNVEHALTAGTDHELALALCGWLRNGILQHAATSGEPVSSETAHAVAANLSGSLAFMIRNRT